MRKFSFLMAFLSKTGLVSREKPIQKINSKFSDYDQNKFQQSDFANKTSLSFRSAPQKHGQEIV